MQQTLRIILITGASASGKSTVAQALAERLPKSVHLRGDAFRKMIVGGREAAGGPDLSSAFLEQLRLRYDIACDAAERYADAGFQVVYQDVILGPLLEQVVSRLRRHGLAVVVLNPAADVVAVREAGRSKRAYRGDLSPQAMVSGLRSTTPRLGLWLDSSRMTVRETVDAIIGRLDDARV
jgi:predicted kinase